MSAWDNLTSIINVTPCEVVLPVEGGDNGLHFTSLAGLKSLRLALMGKKRLVHDRAILFTP